MQNAILRAAGNYIPSLLCKISCDLIIKKLVKMTETKEQILSRMEEIMPFTYSKKVRPYIIEAMKIYANQQLILHGVVKCTCEPHKPTTKWKGDDLIWTCEICKRPC